MAAATVNYSGAISCHTPLCRVLSCRVCASPLILLWKGMAMNDPTRHGPLKACNSRRRGPAERRPGGGEPIADDHAAIGRGISSSEWVAHHRTVPNGDPEDFIGCAHLGSFRCVDLPAVCFPLRNHLLGDAPDPLPPSPADPGRVHGNAGSSAVLRKRSRKMHECDLCDSRRRGFRSGLVGPGRRTVAWVWRWRTRQPKAGSSRSVGPVGPMGVEDSIRVGGADPRRARGSHPR